MRALKRVLTVIVFGFLLSGAMAALAGPVVVAGPGTSPLPEAVEAAPAAATAPTAEPAPAAQGRVDRSPAWLSYLSEREAVLSIALLLFAPLYLTVSGLLLGRHFRGHMELGVRYGSLVFIITAALLLMFVGYDSQQVAPAYGLLGTLAGYILGRSDSRSRAKETQPETPDA